MSGQQSIIERIITDAEKNARDIISKAEEQAASLLDSARMDNKEIDQATLLRAAAEAEEIAAARQRELDLQMRRNATAVRFAAIEEAFLRAKNRLLSLGREQYLDYIKKQIQKHASKGDSVVIRDSDKNLITKAFLDEISLGLGFELPLSDACGDFSGGVVLKNKYWDINLTIEDNFRFFREDFQPVVSKILSGEGIDA